MWNKRKLLVALCAALGTTAVSAHEIKHKNLSIVHPCVYETIDRTAKDVAVYLKIKNLGKTADRLMSASSPRAAKVELQAASTSAVALTAIEVKAGSEVVLRSNGPHLMLRGLTKPLSAYDSFPLTLVFEKAGKIDVEVMVEEAESQPRKPS